MKHTKIVMLILLISFFFSTLSAEGSNYLNVYNIKGIYVGKIHFKENVEQVQARFFPPTTVVYRGGREYNLAAGIYFVTSSYFIENIIPSQRNEFGFEDVTEEYLPLEEWAAGNIEVADMNGDGLNDIVFSIYDENMNLDCRPRIWIQDSEGNFVDETNLRIPDLQAPCYDIELFDVDSDNDIDIFLTGYSSSSYYLSAGLLINDGAGIFTDESDGRLPQLDYPDFAYFAEATEVDDNESIDIVVNMLYENDSLNYFTAIPELWLNDGNGFFVQDSLGRLPNPEDYGFFELITADIDNDNLNDIIFANINYTIYDQYGNVIAVFSGQNACYHNIGNGFFIDDTEIRMPESADRDTRDLAISDVDNDEDMDILEVEFEFVSNQQVRLLKNDGSGYYSVSYGSLPNGLSGWFNDSKFALLNDDEYPDLFMTRVQLGELDYDFLLINNGDGTFVDSTSLLPTNLDFSVSCALFDHQNDNDVDIIIANSGSGVEGDTVGQNVLYHNTLNLISIDNSNTSLPKISKLFQNYPNPFNPTTTISFYLSQDMNMLLEVYNVRGQLIKTLVHNQTKKGQHCIVWDGTDRDGKKVPSGVYFYKLSYGDKSVTKKMLLLR